METKYHSQEFMNKVYVENITNNEIKKNSII